MTTNKPREFWLRPWTDTQPDGFLSGNVVSETSYDVNIEPTKNCIHVIEYSAYAELLTTIEKLRKTFDGFD